ncbi:hypothetical protein JCM19235_4649 [Vibrio maritimus]|uniref:Uncharacterized protein n=1 Tax=Vibrio maritimus TaxID=990268 RepID=A0A090S562_9VIBR|nr:hypothetical protein JCM19235_4649 [Vibrio maritimus]
MDMTLQILVSLSTAMLTGLGIMSMFAPQKWWVTFQSHPMASLV